MNEQDNIDSWWNHQENLDRLRQETDQLKQDNKNRLLHQQKWQERTLNLTNNWNKLC